MNKRTRKKLHIAEFKHYGLIAKFDATEQEFDAVNDFIEDFCDKRKLYVWGGGYSRMTLQHTRKNYQVPNAVVAVIDAIASNAGVKPSYVIYDPKKRHIVNIETVKDDIVKGSPIGKSAEIEEIDIYNQ